MLCAQFLQRATGYQTLIATLSFLRPNKKESPSHEKCCAEENILMVLRSCDEHECNRKSCNLSYISQQIAKKPFQFTNVALNRNLGEEGNSSHNDRSKNAVNKLTHHQVSRGRSVFKKSSSVKANLKVNLQEESFAFSTRKIPACNKLR